MPLDIDLIFDALANRRRRHLLFTLLETNPLPESANYPDSPPDRPTADRASRIRRHHVHLPKLEEYGLIERVDDDIERGPRFEGARPTLELLNSREAELPQLR